MKTLLLVDDSEVLASRLRSAGWNVVGPGDTALPDALAVDPAWKNYEGLAFLYGLQRRFDLSQLPVCAYLREANPSLEALVGMFAIPFSYKNRSEWEDVFLPTVTESQPPDPTSPPNLE